VLAEILEILDDSSESAYSLVLNIYRPRYFLFRKDLIYLGAVRMCYIFINYNMAFLIPLQFNLITLEFIHVEF
jgi:hypothetical protein